MLVCSCGAGVARYEKFKICANGSLEEGRALRHCSQAGVVLCAEHFDHRGIFQKNSYCLECGELALDPMEFLLTDFFRAFEERDVACIVCRRRHGRLHPVYRCGNLLCDDFGKNVCSDHLISTGVLKRHVYCPRCGFRIV